MHETPVTDDQLAAYLQEQLPLADLAAVEKALRKDEALRRRAALLALRRDLGGHSVGSIWRSERLSCPEREELGAYLLGTLNDGRADYVAFHVRTLGCRFCTANLADLRTASSAAPPAAARRQRYFESSAGLVRRSERRS